jgi:hypothetical protein
MLVGCLAAREQEISWIQKCLPIPDLQEHAQRRQQDGETDVDNVQESL